MALYHYIIRKHLYTKCRPDASNWKPCQYQTVIEMILRLTWAHVETTFSLALDFNVNFMTSFLFSGMSFSPRSLIISYIHNLVSKVVCLRGPMFESWGYPTVQVACV